MLPPKILDEKVVDVRSFVLLAMTKEVLHFPKFTQ